MTLYNRFGIPIAYSEDGENIYLFNGLPVAYLVEDCIYNFRGKHIGWFSDGWTRDLYGYCVFFTEDSIGGPVKPIKRIKPIKGIKRIKPIKSIREIRRIRAINRLAWSNYTGPDFFLQ